MGIISFIFALAEDMLLAAIPAVGFAMVFNVPQRALRWCALLGAIGHGSRMIMMSAGFNIEWATFLAALLVGSIGIQMVALVSGASEDFYRRRRDPDVSWHLSLHGDDFRGKNQSFWLFGRDDDFAAEQFFKGLFDCGRPFDWPVDTRPVAVS